MLRAVVLALAVAPMLLPRGLCICRFLPVASAHDAVSAEPCESPRKACGCRHADNDRDHSDESPVQPDDGCPQEHGPICQGLADTSFQLPNFNRIDLTFDAVSIPEAVLPFAADVREARRPFQERPPKTPLFIAGCALLL